MRFFFSSSLVESTSLSYEEVSSLSSGESVDSSADALSPSLDDEDEDEDDDDSTGLLLLFLFDFLLFSF